MSSRVRFSFNQKSLVDILEEMNTGRLVVPDHQRGFVWDMGRQQKLVKNVMDGMPMPPVIVRTQRGGVSNLEDGQQRLTTLRMFYDGVLSTMDGRKYPELTERERTEFESYQVGLVEYKNASDKQVIQIFNHFQNGMALTVGERLYALMRISPFVQYTVNNLLTPGQGIHSLAEEVWGYRTLDNGKRYKNLTQVAALVAGIAYGPGYMSRKWGDLEEVTELDFPEQEVTAKLERLFKIFKEVQTRRPRNRTTWNWNFGNAIGYVAYSLTMEKGIDKDWTNEPPADLDQRWVAYLVEVRDNPDILKDTLHKDLSSARSWTEGRWKNGYNRVFNPDWEGFQDIQEDDDSSDE